MVTPENANAGGGDGDDLKPTSSMLAKIVKFLVGNEEKFSLLQAVREPVEGEWERGAIGQMHFQKALEGVKQRYEEKFTRRTISLCHVCHLHAAYRWCEHVSLRERQKRWLCLKCFLTNNIEAGVINLTKGGVALLEVCRTHAGYKYALCRVALSLGGSCFRQAFVCKMLEETIAYNRLSCIEGMDLPEAMGRGGEAVCIPWQLLEHMMTCSSSAMQGLHRVCQEGLGRAHQFAQLLDNEREYFHFPAELRRMAVVDWASMAMFRINKAQRELQVSFCVVYLGALKDILCKRK
eukprot:gene14464-15967_t